MQIPSEATITNFTEAEPGDLLVYKPNDQGPLMYGIRAILQREKPQSPSPYIIQLNNLAQNGHSKPCVFDNLQNPLTVFSLGKNWFFDVNINDTEPGFVSGNNDVLIRRDNIYFIHLVGERYFNTNNGDLVDSLNNNAGKLFWCTFTIKLRQPDGADPVVIFTYPETV